MFQTLIDFLKSERPHWAYQILKEHNIIALGIQGKDEFRFHVIIDIKEDEKIFIAYSIFPDNATKNNIDNISELIQRLNYDFTVGNFELNLDNGEIRFKNSAKYEDITPTFKYIESLIMHSIYTLNDASTYINAVLSGTMLPQEAYKGFAEV